MIVPVILAAGKSERFGNQKLISLYMGKPLLQWTLDTVNSIANEGILVISSYLDVSRFNVGNLKVVLNEKTELGLSESIKIAIRESKSDEGILIFLGDMPKIKVTLAKKVLSLSGERIVFPSHEGIKGFPVYLPCEYFDEALKINGDKGLKELIISNGDFLTFEGGKACVFDIDLPDDIRN